MNITVAKFLLENNVYKDCGIVCIPTVYYDQIMDNNLARGKRMTRIRQSMQDVLNAIEQAKAIAYMKNTTKKGDLYVRKFYDKAGVGVS